MKIDLVPINSIKPYEKNPRKNDDAVARVTQSLRQFGFRQPIVVDKDNIIVVGHTRYRAAIDLGLTQVPVHVSDLSPADTKAYRIADNRSNQDASWDWRLLGEELAELNSDIFKTLLSKDEIDRALFIFEDAEGLNHEDAIPDNVTYRSKLGDVWVCGNHKVICGDSTKAQTYIDLMGTEVADIMWTDPPYGVDYKQTTGPNANLKRYSENHNKTRIANDDMSHDQLTAFLTDVMQTVKTYVKPGGVFYVTFSDKQALAFSIVMGSDGWSLRQNLIWVKNAPSFSRMDYNSRAEPILYGWREGAGHYFCGDFTKNTVWDHREDLHKLTKQQLIDHLEKYDGVFDYKKPSKSPLHPTTKPVGLIKEHLENSSLSGEIMIDPFGGSGSSLIACENTSRHARLVELEPKYVDTIVKRWQDHTGKKAVHAVTGDEWGA